MEGVVSEADRERPAVDEIEDDEATVRPASPDPAAEHPVPDDAAEPAEQRPIVISSSQVSDLRATTVEIRDSSVDTVHAERVDLTGSRARQVEGRLVQLEQSQAIRVEGTRVVAESTRVGGLIADQARFVRSRVVLVISRQTEVSADSRILIHIGPLRSTVRPMVSTRTAAAFGAGAGLALAVGVRVLGRRSR